MSYKVEVLRKKAQDARKFHIMEMITLMNAIANGVVEPNEQSSFMETVYRRRATQAVRELVAAVTNDLLDLNV